MATKPSPEVQDENSDGGGSDKEVAILRGMSREDRIALLMKSLDSMWGPAPAKRRKSNHSAPDAVRRKK